MIRISLILLITLVLVTSGLRPCAAFSSQETPAVHHAVNDMLGEKLSYDLSFLWFDRLAEGSLSLSPGPEPGQYIALLEARTLGLTAFLTRHRVEKIETLMEIAPDGRLRPIIQSASTMRGEGKDKSVRVRSYQFDYVDRTVLYRNAKTGKKDEERTYEMDKDGPVYDLLSAFYNVRAGLFGPIVRGRHLALPTFTRRGTEDVIIARVVEAEQKRQTFFPDDSILCKVLVDPDVFGTKGRDVFIGMDENMIPRRVIVKEVIGLGDARAVLRKIENTLDTRPVRDAPRTEEK
ncbi:MAG TPA: DUF3108 domain-containing protein [Geopsychrobacteraceae bacterium]|nr:DUF3108 domain-containing protein [Geopsychrobacteraceae bacterium]